MCPGKLCDGTTENAAKPIKDSKAYCEGRAAAAAGALVGTNPHLDGSDAATAWAAGHGSWAENPAGVARDCCSVAYGGGYTP